jgi:hypothetical protein
MPHRPAVIIRKSSRVTEDDARALALESSLGYRETAASYGGRKGTTFERSGPRGQRTVRKISVYLPLETVEQLDVHCALSHRDRSGAIDEAVTAWLRKHAHIRSPK